VEWNRQSDESAIWYSRFEAFRLIGPSRNLDKAYNLAKSSEGLAGNRPGSAWYKNSERFGWTGRAEAWDTEEREKLRADEAIRRFDARQRRLSAIQKLQEHAYAALSVANLSQLDEAAARLVLPELRRLYEAMVRAERLEYGDATEIVASAAEFTADDYARAHAELEQWQKTRNGSNAQPVPTTS